LSVFAIVSSPPIGGAQLPALQRCSTQPVPRVAGIFIRLSELADQVSWDLDALATPRCRILDYDGVAFAPDRRHGAGRAMNVI
jgi:hypothetical protein